VGPGVPAMRTIAEIKRGKPCCCCQKKQYRLVPSGHLLDLYGLLLSGRALRDEAVVLARRSESGGATVIENEAFRFRFLHRVDARRRRLSARSRHASTSTRSLSLLRRMSPELAEIVRRRFAERQKQS
jgi:hypothetical protein